MTALGFALLLVGAALMVAEAHAPGGVLGMLGALGLVAGGVVIIGALGGGLAVAVPVAVGIALATGAWTVIAARKAAGARRARIQAGAEALCGRLGVVQRWTEPTGHVFVEGALWRAEHDWAGREEHALEDGDRVVVMSVHGLTLCVRRAEDWELVA